MHEFELIRQVFREADYARPGGAVVRSIGDDCALLHIAVGEQLAVSTDSLLEDVHFPAGADGFLLGQRALAVAVSDLAAMGARPLAFTLALSLPRADVDWLRELSRGLQAMAQQTGTPLVGGDTTRGPLNIGVTVMGTVPDGQALLRSGAKPGQQLWVSGPLGAATAALQVLQDGDNDYPGLFAAYWSPRPQLELGQWLRGKDGAALDVSDGLLADAGHMAAESGVRLVIERELVPVHPEALALSADRAPEWALCGGDDYQLVFTLFEQQAAALQAQFPQACCIGRVCEGQGVLLVDGQGRPVEFSRRGYQHF
ncbi:thiamine-phosphate kinase [Thiopseudomonas denitrificans]|uniref:Thiamine-monophosphate kinase n=1 Tax=Thiopseudomonas denitrificans TaxID=1501432 RepID=A0A4R6TXT9_9GAMM|nr:thiamine-phosphate kinase [Thiopseudomonas denitrificans]TDQ36829.1 thiamine-phosphate kinase [Thiopseudomonas denitrificans]